MCVKKKEILFWFYFSAECSDLEFRFDIIKLCLGFTLDMNFNKNFNDSHSSLYLKGMEIESFQYLLVFKLFQIFCIIRIPPEPNCDLF